MYNATVRNRNISLCSINAIRLDSSMMVCLQVGGDVCDGASAAGELWATAGL